MAGDRVSRDDRADRTPADGADPTRCGCAGKTPLRRVVLPARDRVADALGGTSVELGADADAAVLPTADSPTRIERATEAVALDGTPLSVPFDDGDDAHSAAERDRSAPVVTLACAVLGDDLADPDRLGDALATAYGGLDGPDVRIGKGHAVQVPGASGGRLWVEHLRPEPDAGGGAVPDDGSAADSDYEGRAVAANVDAVHAFPVLDPPTQARIAVLNALNDAHAVGATVRRTVRPLVATPHGGEPEPGRVTGWYREGVPADVTVLPPSTVSHDGDGWLLGASVAAAGGHVAEGATPPALPGECEVLLTRPLGGLACFARGVVAGEGDRRERGLAALRRDTRPVAEAVDSLRPASGEAFDPARHVARVTDVSGEGIAGLGRLAAAEGRSLRLRRLPLLTGAEAAAEAWTVPDATVETNGPLAVFAAPAVLGELADGLRGVDGADPRRVGSLDEVGPAILDATDGALARAVEPAARWPTAGDSR
ncbi:hypothetical protein [Halobaculum sp. EA56]|uniref:hypothetical protein n=1 Tax=Halobaculum sp. EA56 TaxID=3421648 RepID=UPI003EB9E361